MTDAQKDEILLKIEVLKLNRNANDEIKKQIDNVDKQLSLVELETKYQRISNLIILKHNKSFIKDNYKTIKKFLNDNDLIDAENCISDKNNISDKDVLNLSFEVINKLPLEHLKSAFETLFKVLLTNEQVEEMRVLSLKLNKNNNSEHDFNKTELYEYVEKIKINYKFNTIKLMYSCDLEILTLINKITFNELNSKQLNIEYDKIINFINNRFA
jgi:hypothetical protein